MKPGEGDLMFVYARRWEIEPAIDNKGYLDLKAAGSSID